MMYNTLKEISEYCLHLDGGGKLEVFIDNGWRLSKVLIPIFARYHYRKLVEPFEPKYDEVILSKYNEKRKFVCMDEGKYLCKLLDSSNYMTYDTISPYIEESEPVHTTTFWKNKYPDGFTSNVYNTEAAAKSGSYEPDCITQVEFIGVSK